MFENQSSNFSAKNVALKCSYAGKKAELHFQTLNVSLPRCGGFSTAPGLRGADGPGVVLPELVGVLDFGTGVAAFSLWKKIAYRHGNKILVTSSLLQKR